MASKRVECADSQNALSECLKNKPKRALECGPVVKAFVECADKARAVRQHPMQDQPHFNRHT